MVRFKGNPIIKPIKEHPWESRYVFNTAMVRLGERIHYFYRAIGEDMVSRLGYASSKDGYNIDERLPLPVFEPSCDLEKFGCEDPRLSVMDSKCLMTYTAYGDIYQIGITSISIDDLLDKKWEWRERCFPFPNVRNKNAVIFPRKIDGRFVMFHRLEPCIHVAYSDDLTIWDGSGLVMSPRPGSWDCYKIGAAGPPMELDDVWLLVYHGVDSDKVYRLGVALLEKEDPERILYRCKEPIIEPTEEYERVGQVPNVIFSCGSVLVGDKLLVSYGAADTVIGIATFNLDEIIP